MKARSQSILVKRDDDWLEYVVVMFGTEAPISKSGDELHLQTREFEFGPPLGPLVVAERMVREGYEPNAKNGWADARSSPRAPTGVERADRGLSDELFWSTVDCSSGPFLGEALWSVRASLADLSRDEVLRYQFSLVTAVRRLVDDLGCSWGSAGLTVLRGSEFTRQVAARERPTPLSDSWEFEDLTDVAEEVIGARIEIDDFGHSREKTRDLQPVLPDEIKAHMERNEFALGVPEWDVLPWRWASWRVTSEREGSQFETIVLANRAWGTSIGMAAEDTVGMLEARGDRVGGVLEYVDPRVRRPHLGWPPVHYFESVDRPDLDRFLHVRGYR